MTAEICSCKGLDPKCKKCHGSGYVDYGNPKNKEAKIDKKIPAKARSKFPVEIGSLSKEALATLATELIGELDLRSKKQMQLLNSIPFNTNTFRRDSKEKFEELKKLESEKQKLRNELSRVDEEIASKQYSGKFSFKHYLSDKEIDVDSNRQLKALIKAYKSLKSKSGTK